MSIVDPAYFRELQETEPDTICQGEKCTYDPDKKTYEIEIWGDRFIIDPASGKINCISKHVAGIHEYFDLFVVFYLLRAKAASPQMEWISENDLPGGPTFFRGPHLIPTHKISDTYTNDIDSLRKKCEENGGKPLDMGDAAYEFSITKDLPIALIYWLGDEDFPAEARILYDRSIGKILSLDIIFALAVEVCHRLSAK